MHIVEFAVPFDSRVVEKKEKIEKYQDLARELKKIWNMKVKVVPYSTRISWNDSTTSNKEIRGYRYKNAYSGITENSIANSARIVRKELEL